MVGGSVCNRNSVKMAGKVFSRFAQMHVENGDHGRPVFLWFFVDCMFLKLFLALTTSMKCPKINETLRLMLGRLMQACTTAAGVMVTLRHGSLKCAN